MKKIIVIALMISMFVDLSLQAQTEKGKLFIAGSSQFGLSQGSYRAKYDGDLDEDSKYAHFSTSFQPKIGFTVIDNMPIGLWGNIATTIYKSKSDDGKTINNSYTGGVFIRYYFADLLGLKPYAEASTGYGISSYGYKSSSGDWDPEKEHVFTFKLGAGLTYFFSDYIGIDLMLGYNHENHTRDLDMGEGDEVKFNGIYNEFFMQVGIVGMLKCKRH